ncbi:MAG: Chromate resistance protein ChrB [Conexibacter sp.]
MPQRSWVLLSYRVPREPSTPRIAVWRTLRRLGVARLNDGLVALPHDARTREQLEWLAEEVVQADGEATIWLAEPGSIAHERELIAQMRAAVAEEYRALKASAAASSPSADRRTLARLRRELRAIGRRDYFAAPERKQATAALEALAEQLEQAA